MPEQIANVFLSASVEADALSEDDINRCLAKLSDEQMWHRGADHENSIANPSASLRGTCGSGSLHGIDGQPDVRKRDAEFTLSPSQALRRGSQLLYRNACGMAAGDRLRFPLERLLEVIDPSNRDWGPCHPGTILSRHRESPAIAPGAIILLTKTACGHRPGSVTATETIVAWPFRDPIPAGRRHIRPTQASTLCSRSGWPSEPVADAEALPSKHAHFTGAADSSAARCGQPLCPHSAMASSIESASRDTYV